MTEIARSLVDTYSFNKLTPLEKAARGYVVLKNRKKPIFEKLPDNKLRKSK